MYKSNLIEIFRSLKPDEVKEFGYFVRSPFFNRNQGLIRFYDFLKKQYPDFNESSLKKEYVYKSVFEKIKYNDGFMRVLISNLTKLLQEFLVIINIKSRPSRYKLHLMNELNLRKLTREFRLARKDTEKTLELLPKTDMWYYNDKAIYEDNNYYFNSWSSYTRKKSVLSEEQSLKSIIDNFTRFYLIASLTMYRKVLHINNYSKVNVDLKFTEEILSLLEKYEGEFSDAPIINLHINEIMLLAKGDKKYFNSLKNIFLNEKGEYTYIELYSLHNILQGYMANQIFKGNFFYEKEKFMLLNSAISKKILVYPFQKHIEGNIFISAVNSAISVGEISWAELFINNYLGYIKQEKKDEVLALCLARIHYAKRNNEQALLLLNNVKSKNIENMVNYKILQLEIYYDQALYVEAALLIDSYRHLLNRAEKVVAPVIFESYKNFIKNYSLLIKAKEKGKSEFAFELFSILKKNKVTQDYHWLKRKTEEILKFNR